MRGDCIRFRNRRRNAGRLESGQATEVLDNSVDDILTLVTCYPFYFVGPAPKRFIVRARRISK